MIQYNLCNQWYHYDCVGTNADEAAKIDFTCPESCTRRTWYDADIFLSLIFLSWTSVMFIPLLYLYVVISQTLNKEESVVKSTIISCLTCQEFLSELIGCLTNVMSKNAWSCLLSITWSMHCHLCRIAMVGSNWLHILSMLISLQLFATIPLFVKIDLVSGNRYTRDGNLTRLSAALRVWLRKTWTQCCYYAALIPQVIVEWTLSTS